MAATRRCARPSNCATQALSAATAQPLAIARSSSTINALRSTGTMAVVRIVAIDRPSPNQRELKSQPLSAAARTSRQTSAGVRSGACCAVCTSCVYDSGRGVSASSHQRLSSAPSASRTALAPAWPGASVSAPRIQYACSLRISGSQRASTASPSLAAASSTISAKNGGCERLR